MADKIVILEDSEGNNIYPISRGLATNSVDTNAIQSGAVTSNKIDWTTMSENNNNIRKIYTTTITGTTDENGFMTVDTNIILPSNAIIIGTRGHGIYSGFYFVFTDVYNLEIPASRFTIRCLGWDFSAHSNTYRECDIAYIKVN